MRSALGWLLIVVIAAAQAQADEPPAFAADQLEFFEREVRPLLVTHCYECHSGEAEKLQGGLRLDSRTAILTGGDTGPAAEAGAPGGSLLIDAINYGDLYQMPPKSKMSDDQIAVITRWIEMGMPWPQEEHAGPANSAEFNLEQRKAAHWAWRPVQAVAPPQIQQAEWPRDDIDRYVLATLEATGLSPAPETDRRTWIRRVYFDLIGLPPSPTEVRDFVEDTDQNAHEKVVDHLLNSPHFGERWARHWLDLVRYSESRGHEFDYDIPNAHQYRDYVIRALNADVPYDQFVIEHIAGDLVEQPRLHPLEGFPESILGTGFWYLGEWVHSPVDIRKDECDRFDNMIDVFSKTFLGLTVACARCHEHKFDAISQKDYYALAGFLQSSAYRQVAFDTMEHNATVARELDQFRSQAQQRIAEALSENADTMFQPMSNWLDASSSALERWSATVSPEAIAEGANRAELPVELAVQARAAADRANLPASPVEYWTRQLLRATQDPQDPLWLLARLAILPESQRQVPGLIAQWESTSRAIVDEAMATWQGVSTIIDYQQSPAEHWMTDGFAFGLRPVRPGQWLIENGKLRIALHGAAHRDPLWNPLKLSDGVEPEVARLASWNRVGKTIRTPTFDLDNRPLHYLVRGSGIAYAVVDSHAMINGPLHGSLLHEFKANADQSLQWVTHDLRRYAGHDAHVEFSPNDEGAFELLMVIQAPHPPALPKKLSSGPLIEAVKAAAPSDRKALSELYGWHFAESFRFTPNVAEDSTYSDDMVALRHWSWEHWQQSRLPDDRSPVTELIGTLSDEQQRVAERIRLESLAAPAMWEGTGRDELLLIRGNVRTPSDPVPRRFLEAIDAQTPTRPTGSGRLDLARRVVSPDNPFISRVYVNRIWHHVMGRGIVASTDNFGVLGELPTHPELLDHLALSFVNDGWSTKRLIRRIVLSSTYRMSSSTADDRAEELDPQNKLWHRMPVRRLQGEVIRDSLLSISGRLDPTMYGRSVPVHLTPFMQGRGRPTESGALDGNGRRSIYVEVRRNFLSPMMLAFDTPQPFSTVGRRSVSNVPAQALILMNDPFVKEQCERWANRVLSEDPSQSIDTRVARLYETAFARPPADDERSAAKEFVLTQGAEYDLTPEQAMHDPRVWTDLCHVLVNLKEFIFVR